MNLKFKLRHDPSSEDIISFLLFHNTKMERKQTKSPRLDACRVYIIGPKFKIFLNAIYIYIVYEF